MKVNVSAISLDREKLRHVIGEKMHAKGIFCRVFVYCVWIELSEIYVSTILRQGRQLSSMHSDSTSDVQINFGLLCKHAFFTIIFIQDMMLLSHHITARTRYCISLSRMLS